jgi:hypothetical protein
LFLNGTPKPALQAYQLPLYVKKAGKGVVVWGRIPAAVGDRTVAIRPSRGREVRVHVRDPHGYFTKRLGTRAPSYTLAYGDLVSRIAKPR